MNKIKNNKIGLALALLAVLVLEVLVIPAKVSAEQYGRGSNGTGTGAVGGYVTSYDLNQNSSSAPAENPEPTIKSISPSSSNIGVGTKTITIVGEGFVPGSIARINGSNRPTTFIDSSHLLMQITGNDTLKYQSNGGFFITVFSGAPGGGYSNAVFFTVNKIFVPASATDNNVGGVSNVNDTGTNFTDFPPNTVQTENGDSARGDNSNLASNAIFGTNGFMPSGFIQWVFVAIIVLLIVILARRIFGADAKYHAKPLKHD